MFDAAIAQFAFHVLLQSTLLIFAGFMAVRLCGRHKPALQSAILRVTLIAVLLCPLVSLALGKMGVTEFAMLPAWETSRETQSHKPLPSGNTISSPVAGGERSAQFSTERDAESAPHSERIATGEPNPESESYQNVELLSGLPAGIPSPKNADANLSSTSESSAEYLSNAASSSSLMPVIGWFVALTWLAGAVVLLTKLTLANLLVARLRRGSREAGVDVQELCRQTSKTLGLLPPETKTSRRIHSPCLIGIRQPLILLPEQETLSRPVMRDVFLHELAHLARRDCLFHLLARLATAVLFFQPLVWWLSRRLEQIADDICDDYVIQYGADRKSYANTLVNFAERLPLQWTTAQAGLGMVSFRSSLSRRVIRILDSSRSLTLRLNTGWIVVNVLLGISATTSAALIVNAQAALVIKDEKSVKAARPDEDSNVDIALEVAEQKNSDNTANRALPEATKKQKSDATTEPVFRFQGKIVDPDGKPVKQATINYTHWNRSDSPVLATANDQGTFDFKISPSDKFYSFLQEVGGTFVAMADGYGPAVKSAHECETTGEMFRALQRRVSTSAVPASFIEQTLKKILSGSATFQLVADDVPLTGRVVDIDGQPVEGAKLKVAKLMDGGRGGLDAWEKAARTAGTDYYQLQNFLGMSLGNDIGGTTLDFIPAAVTDKNGRFTLKGIGRDRVVKLLISGPGIATSRVFARTRKGEIIEVQKEARRSSLNKIVYHPATFTHVAGPSLPVEGIVRDAKTQKPMAGVTLQSYQLAGQRMGGWTEGIVQTVSDDQGRYRLEGLPIGKNQVICLSSIDQPYIASKFTAEIRAGGATLKKNLELTRGIWIEGRAYDKSTGKPIRSGRVHYFAFTNNPFARAVKGFNGAHISMRYRLNPDGTYRIPGLPGRGIVAIMADRDHTKYQRGMGAEKIEGKDNRFNIFNTYPHFASALNFHVLSEVNPAEDAESIQLDFQFDSGRSLKVQVVDQNGKPISGGRYYGMMEVFSNWQLIQGNQLKINGYRPEKPRRVQVYHKELKLVGFLLIEGKNPGDLKITLQPWAEITGRLLDKAGVPKANATISNVYRTVRENPKTAVLPPNINQQTGQHIGFVTDENGRFTIAGLVPGKQHSLSATEIRRNGMLYGLGEIPADFTLKPGEVRDLGDVQLKQ